jgi:hypothetical protein
MGKSASDEFKAHRLTEAQALAQTMAVNESGQQDGY